MKKILALMIISLGIVGFMATSALACNCGKKKQGADAMSCQCKSDSCGSITEKKSSNLNKSTNTLCPVSGKPIGSMGKGVSHVYAGKTYKLCCEGCVKPFKDNPEKYLNKNKTN